LARRRLEKGLEGNIKEGGGKNNLLFSPKTFFFGIIIWRKKDLTGYLEFWRD